MKILAIDSSGEAVSAAIADDEKIIAEYLLNFKVTHSQTLMPAVDNIVKTSGISLNEIDYIACTSGPGSFTGLRIGASAAKGLAHGLGIKIIPVPTLLAMSYNISETDRIICPIMDARRGQVYNAFYQWEDGKICQIESQDARSIDDVIKKASEFKRKVIFLGDAVKLYIDRIHENEMFCTALSNCNVQRASSLACAAFIMKDLAIDCGSFVPEYIRKSQAERELEEKKN